LNPKLKPESPGIVRGFFMRCSGLAGEQEQPSSARTFGFFFGAFHFTFRPEATSSDFRYGTGQHVAVLMCWKRSGKVTFANVAPLGDW
jgi:hypothetical protein